MKTVFLHIGLGKTGTTSIQRHLARDTERLLASGIHYVQCGGGERGTGHQQFAKSFVKSIPDYMIPVREPERVREAVFEEVLSSQQAKIVMSSENFSLADPAEIRRQFEALPVTCQFKVILFVRSQDELAESEYNQLVKVRAERRTFEQFLEEDFLGDFYGLARRWEKVFGQSSLICSVYDGRRRSVIEDFLHCLGLAVKTRGGTAGPAPNRSLGYLALLMKRGLNHLSAEDNRPVHYELPQHVRDALDPVDLPAILFNSEHARRIRGRFTGSNRRLTQRYLGREVIDLGGRRFTDEERDSLFGQCRQLVEF